MACAASALGKFTFTVSSAMQDSNAGRQPALPAKIKQFLSCLPDSQARVRTSALSQNSAGNLFDDSHSRFINLVQGNPRLKPVAAQKLQAVTEELVNTEANPVEKLKQGFLNFKQQKYLKNPKLFDKLSAGQSPKYMAVACGDSRVCPTSILGFEPGEAFVIRNVANLVPVWDAPDMAGTNAAVEFAVLALKVEHLIVIGHSRCGGIKALMSLPDPTAPPKGVIEKWISIAKPARESTVAAVGNHSFEAQCTHCEKESVNNSLSNLLTFPFVKDLVSQEKLFLHGGYYNFVDGSFELWSLSSKADSENVQQQVIDQQKWS